MAEDVSVPAAEHEHSPPVTAEAPAEGSPPADVPEPVAPPEPAAVVETHEPAPAPVPEAPEPLAAVAHETAEPAAAAPPVAEEAAVAEAEEEEEEESAEEEEAAEEPPKENRKRWYVVKVQSGREDTIKEAIERRVRKEGLEEFYGQIVIPVEKVTEVKTDKHGKRVTKTKERKLYPGYLMCEVEYNDRILYLFRETSGVGDFVGAQPGNLDKPPTPMSEPEIQRMLGRTHAPEEPGTAVPPKPKDMDVGDRVRVVDGIFNGMEGTVKQILEALGKVQVEVTIFNRPTVVDLEYYQVEQA
jgi:transcriptional antiterminator NusG